jgi:hypothetical protein
MSNSYYDLTGVLRLTQATPVIKALFGGMNLDPEHPGHGEAYFCQISESTSQTWEDVLEQLDELATALGVTPEPAAEDEDDADALLWALAKHFKGDEKEAFAALMEGSTFDEEADLESLFVLARAFDDGHGLSAILYEGCWHSDRPRLFEFGGDGGFIGQQLTVSGTSTLFMQLGESLEAALLHGSVDEATAHLVRHVDQLLGGLDSAEYRQQIRAALGASLAAQRQNPSGV